MNLPNIITVTRLLLVPFIAFLLYSKNPILILVSALLFAVAVISDWLDGFIARKTKTTSNFGTLFDPIVDKIMVLTMFFILVDLKLIPIWIAVLLLLREVMVSYVRHSYSTESKIIGANWMGKSKFIMQTAVIFYAQIYLYLFYSNTSLYFFNKTIIFYFSLIVVILSLIYLVRFMYRQKEGVLSNL